jgi:hypothetical protein
MRPTHTNRWSASSFIVEKYIIATLRYLFAPMRIAKVPAPRPVLRICKDEEQLELSYTAGGLAKLKNSL